MLLLLKLFSIIPIWGMKLRSLQATKGLRLTNLLAKLQDVEENKRKSFDIFVRRNGYILKTFMEKGVAFAFSSRNATPF